MSFRAQRGISLWKYRTDLKRTVCASRPWCRRMLARFQIASNRAQSRSPPRVATRRVDMNIWSGKKLLEKLNYVHNNPVRRGLAAQPGRLAVVELAVLLSGRQLDPQDGSGAVRLRRRERGGVRQRYSGVRARWPRHKIRCRRHPRCTCFTSPVSPVRCCTSRRQRVGPVAPHAAGQDL